MTSILDQIKAKRQAIADKQAGSKNTYKFKQRSTVIRILPSWRKEEENGPFYHDFGQAFIKDLDGNLLAVVGDRKMTYGEDDPVRNLISLAVSEAPTEAIRDHYKNTLAKQKHLLNALILNDKDIDPKEPQIVELSQTQLDNVFMQMEKILLDGDDPISLENGYNLEVEKEGTGLLTRYKFLFERKPSKVDSSVMNTVNDLDSYVRAKFADSDRAINAIKSITQGSALAITDRSADYTTSSKITDAEFESVVENVSVSDVVETAKINATEEEIDALLKGF